MELEEKVLVKEQWIVEGRAVIEDIKAHVSDAVIANLEGSDKNVFINITTKENKRITVEMAAEGFRIVDQCYDSCANPDGQWYETPYALLNQISPCYRDSFGKNLIDKLSELQQEQSITSVD